MDTAARPRRSVLYMPGSNTRAMQKGKALPADGLILDLEDSVAPEAKVEARGLVKAALEEGGYGAREIRSAAMRWTVNGVPTIPPRLPA